jgi:hypothetical protein
MHRFEPRTPTNLCGLGDLCGQPFCIKTAKAAKCAKNKINDETRALTREKVFVSFVPFVLKLFCVARTTAR